MSTIPLALKKTGPKFLSIVSASMLSSKKYWGSPNIPPKFPTGTGFGLRLGSPRKSVYMIQQVFIVILSSAMELNVRWWRQHSHLDQVVFPHLIRKTDVRLVCIRFGARSRGNWCSLVINKKRGCRLLPTTVPGLPMRDPSRSRKNTCFGPTRQNKGHSKQAALKAPIMY